MSDIKVSPEDRIAAEEPPLRTGRMRLFRMAHRRSGKRRRTLGSWIVGLLNLAFVAAVLGFAIVLFGFWYYGRDLPGIAKLADYEPPIVSRVYAGDGRLIGEFATEKRIFVPYRLIPKTVVHAFVSAEDQRFFNHRGVDLIGTIRAGLTTAGSYLTGGRRVVGGSTITQQVAKNFFFTSEKTLKRKIREIVLAMRIESALSKEQILELYLNEIFLGNRAYGVAAAAQTYFNKPLRDLSIAEAAVLAGMPQAPSRYNPFKNPKAALARRTYVVQRMSADGFISADEARLALRAPLGLVGQETRTSVGAEYFVEELRRELIAKYGEEKMKKGGYSVRSTLDPALQQYADEALRKGLVAYDRRHGYRGPVARLAEVHGARWAENWRKKLSRVERPAGAGSWSLAVVLKTEKNRAAIGFADGARGTIPVAELAWARKQGVRTRESGKKTYAAVGPRIRNAGSVLWPGDVILVEPVRRTQRGKAYPEGTYTLRQIPIATGALVAMDPHTGRILAMSGGFSFRISQFNTATQARRQPGSAFKPVVFLTALENGFTPTTKVLDAPVVVRLPDGEFYKPLNHSGKFYGPTTLRRGLELSRNVMTIRLAQRVGLSRVSEMAGRLGIAKNLPSDMSVALGAYETTPLRMAVGYSMIVNGGRRVTPTLVDRIQDRRGRTVFRHDPVECAACREPEWQNQEMPQIPDKREQVIGRQSAFQIVSILQGAVQRGTGRRVAEVGRPLAGKTGTTNDIVDTWFVGMSPGLVAATWVGFEKSFSLGQFEEGARTAAPVFRDFMKKALSGPEEDFRPPKGLVAIRIEPPAGKDRKGGGEPYLEYFKIGVEPGSAPDGLTPGSAGAGIDKAASDEY
ncbi:MAG: penicillin-binding protein 1A [Rhodospirillaceae bacterium]|nr:penicillin-binding protein 1A [Rhodospirillaceae bacterium]MYB14429.1 penicillin-binding protein 1A [Rhodospirillaceae bacterium]MYI49655.1 penicillin-binding protein 1A [Rhodospirillaceae bacterium]